MRDTLMAVRPGLRSRIVPAGRSLFMGSALRGPESSLIFSVALLFVRTRPL